MKLKTLAALAASFALAAVSYGSPWQFNAAGGEPLDFLYSGDTSYSGTFDLTAVGFINGTDYVTSASATFWFADDEANWNGNAADGGSEGGGETSTDPDENVKILINGTTLIANQEVDGSHAAGYASYTFPLTAGQLAALQDGVVSFEVQRLNGDTYLKKAQINAIGGSNQKVPDGGLTAALLGLGFLSLVAARNRLTR